MNAADTRQGAQRPFFDAAPVGLDARASAQGDSAGNTPLAFYNEIDPYAAAWLRNLIAAGHIAPGVVDERSIEDLRPADLAGFTQCHFFAGVGVWSLALRRAGVPDDAPVWTGSCPCQPFSAAGKGDGMDDERHLWPAFFHLIDQLHPAVVFGEQVASKDVDPWIDLVCADLEGVGYAVGAVPFPSAGVGAPHIRDRCYWVANTAHGGRREERAHAGRRPVGDRAQGLAAGFVYGGGARGLGYANGQRTGRNGGAVPRALGRPDWQHLPEHAGAPGAAGGLGHAVRDGAEPDARDRDRAQGAADGIDRGAARASAAAGDDGAPGGLADADGTRGEAGLPEAGQGKEGDAGVTDDGGDQLGGPAGAFASARTGPTNGLWRTADWLLCRDGKWRPVEPGTFPLAHGAPARVGRLRAYGNAINAEAACQFILAAEEARHQRLDLSALQLVEDLV